MENETKTVEQSSNSSSIITTNRDWSKISGWITTAIVVLVMFALNYFGVINFDNKDNVVFTSKATAQMLTVAYLDAQGNNLVPEKAEKIMESIVFSFRQTAENIKNQNFDSKEAKDYAIKELSKIIDEKVPQGTTIVKELSIVTINRVFQVLDQKINETSTKSVDYSAVLNAIADGISSGYYKMYPNVTTPVTTEPVVVPETPSK